MLSLSNRSNSSSSSGSLTYAFQKHREYKKLVEYRQHFVNRGAGFENWVEKLDVLNACMELPWDVLILKERFQNSEREYLEVYPRAHVFKQILHTLEEVVGVLGVFDDFNNETTSATKAEDMEFNFSSVIDALHQVSLTKVIFKSIKEPNQLNAHEQSYWSDWRYKLEDARQGKIVMRAWEVPGLSSLCAAKDIVVEDYEGDEVVLKNINKRVFKAESSDDDSER